MIQKYIDKKINARYLVSETMIYKLFFELQKVFEFKI